MQPGSTINDRYEIQHELGRGGMGVVYRVYDRLLQRPVALKVLSDANIGDANRARLIQEARTTARLNHPNIVTVFDAGETQGIPYIVMELVEGQTLAQRGVDSVLEILNYARQICAALVYAHNQGVIHRDLKPENIFITQENSIKVMDFGLARYSENRLTVSGDILRGTVYYIAPEQVTGGKIDHRVDLYALGVLLYELLAGHLPFQGDDPLVVIAQHLHAEPAPLKQEGGGTSAELESIVLKLLAKNPDDRYASAQEVLNALGLIGAGQISKRKQPSRNNLPVQLSRFIGRQEEIQEVKKLLRSARMVTLTGPGGSGKTRLSLEVARQLEDGYSGGVWLVELASLFDAQLVPQVVAAELGVREEQGRTILATLIDFISSQPLMLVLDNCEHLIVSCAQLAEQLLLHCPELNILASSQEPLGLPGEIVLTIPSLSFPIQEQPAPVEDLLRFEAIQLFLDRARNINRDFDLNQKNGLEVARICQRLDGIPLAIELAAARVKVMTPEQIANRLDDRFNLLTVGSRTALPRHQTLLAAVDWSYHLLSENEQMLLRRLSAFSGGWTLEAAEEVCSGNGIARSEVLNLLSQLVNKSLVLVNERHGAARYGRLESIRQFAQQKMVESGGQAELMDKHLQYYAELAELTEPKLFGPEQVDWLARLETEHDNFRSALDWSIKSDRHLSSGLRLAGALAQFWVKRGYLSEGRVQLSNLLTLSEIEKYPECRAKLLLGAANLAYRQSDYKTTKTYFLKSLDLYKKLGNKGKRGVAEALIGLGNVATEGGDYQSSPAFFEEALTISRELGDRRGIAESLRNLGWAALRPGDYVQAKSLLLESLRLYREIEDYDGIGFSLSGLGEIAVRTGEYDLSIEFLNESLAIRRSLGNRWGIGATLGTLGWVAMRQKDFDQAEAAFSESLQVRRGIGDKGGMAWCLERFAEIAFEQRDFERSVRFYSAADALRKSIGSEIDPVDQADYHRKISSLKSEFGEEFFAQIWETGQKLDLDEMIALANRASLFQ